MKTILTLIVFCTFTLFYQNISAQTFPIKITLHQPPIGQLNAANLWKATLNNSTGKPLRLYLEGYAEEEKAGRIVEGTTKIFTIPNGSKEYMYQDFKDGSVKWFKQDYEKKIIRTGNAPDGTYKICMLAKDENGEIVGMEQCITQIIENITQSEINLVSPEDGEKIKNDNPLFIWSPPLPAPKGQINYELKIFVLSKGQSYADAVKNNKPFFTVNKIKSTQFQYPISAPKIKKDESYVWQVSSSGIYSKIFYFINSQSILLFPTINFISAGNCCFLINVTGSYPWDAFQLTSENNSIIMVNPENSNNTIPSPILSNPPDGKFVLFHPGYPFPNGNNYAGKVCFAYSPNPFPVSIIWSTNSGSTFPSQSPQNFMLSCSNQCTCGETEFIFRYRLNNQTIWDTLKCDDTLNFNSSTIFEGCTVYSHCEPQGMGQTVSWTIYDESDNTIAATGYDTQINFTPLTGHSYIYNILSECCGILCDTCKIYLREEDDCCRDFTDSSIVILSKVYDSSQDEIVLNLMLNINPSMTIGFNASIIKASSKVTSPVPGNEETVFARFTSASGQFGNLVIPFNGSTIQWYGNVWDFTNTPIQLRMKFGYGGYSFGSGSEPDSYVLKDNIKYCIRFSYTDVNFITCETVRFYEESRFKTINNSQIQNK